MDYTKALFYGYPGKIWESRGTYESIVFLDGTPKPTEQELDAILKKALKQEDIDKKTKEIEEEEKNRTYSDVSREEFNEALLANVNLLTKQVAFLEGVVGSNLGLDLYGPTAEEEKKRLDYDTTFNKYDKNVKNAEKLKNSLPFMTDEEVKEFNAKDNKNWP